MPFRSEWALSREGFTIDTVINILNKTIANPLLTIPLYLLSKYTERGRAEALQRPKSAKALLAFLAIGVIGKLRAFLDRGAVNNWKNDVYDWKKEIVVVTGGSDGIGARVVHILAERGIKIVVLDVQPLKYESMPNVFYFRCDLSNPKEIKSVCEDVKNFVGHPTVLVNNAGFARGKAFMDISPDDLRLTFQINTLAHYHLAQQFLPQMVARDHGMIVTIASLAGFVAAPRMIDYAGSKAAAIAFHEGLQAELATIYKAPRVRMVLMCQNYTRTSLFEGFHAGDGFTSFPLEVDTVAERIAKAILRGRSDTILMPHAAWWTIAGLRGTSLWWQTAIRKDLVKVMKQWNGRQVEQPSEAKAGDKSVEGSGVLV